MGLPWKPYCHTLLLSKYWLAHKPLVLIGYLQGQENPTALALFALISLSAVKRILQLDLKLLQLSRKPMSKERRKWPISSS